ncbi:O-antigen ligase family protein [Actinomadura gamaensis]|uniref:O-antigen ligase family protein n=1 Tax=Actinomadura gamaensis TaxID=1763541 RepID=A0ABV9U1F5_9ACTN
MLTTAPDVAAPEVGSSPRGRRRVRVTAVVLVLSIASLPMLMPFGMGPGPGNTAIPDVLLVLLTGTTLLWATSQRRPVHWPFLVPTLLAVLAGTIASVVNDGAGALPLIKDVFVLLWAVCIATLCQEPGMTRIALRAYVYLGTLYAVLEIAGMAAGIEALSGKQVDGARAMFTFGDANYASNWFICVFFIARAAQVPRRKGARWTVCAVLLTAEFLTGSNGGALALVVALVVGYLWRLVRDGKAHYAVAAGALAVLLSGGTVAVLSQVNVGTLVEQVGDTAPILRDSIGRTTGESTESRGTVLNTTLTMLREQRHPFGIGPNEVRRHSYDEQYSYVREAHNDYIAAVLERGFLGGVAVVTLVFVLLLRCVRIARRGALDREYADLVPHPELFGALVVVFLVSALFYQTLHYRHGWAFFGLIAAVDLYGRRQEVRS